MAGGEDSTHQPGKGGAYLQVELKGLTTGTKLNERFRSSGSVEKYASTAAHTRFCSLTTTPSA